MVEPRRALSTLPGNRLLARRGEAAGAGRGVKKTLSSLCTGAVQCAPIAAAPASVEVHRSQEIEVACSSFESIALGRATQVELPPYRDDDAEGDAEIERITFAAKRAVALPISIHALEKRADGGSWGRSGSAPNLPALALNIKPLDECQPRNRSQLGGKYNKCSLLVIFYDVEYVERSV